jgi:hypothetical protein
MGSTQRREYNWGATWKKKQRLLSRNREYGRKDLSRWPHGTLYSQKLALTSPTSGIRSVGTGCSRTQATEFFITRVENYLIFSIGSETPYLNKGDESNKLLELSAPNYLPSNSWCVSLDLDINFQKMSILLRPHEFFSQM